MGSFSLSKKESTFFIGLFLINWVASSQLLLIFSFVVSLVFLWKRKEIYFFWSLIAPRITGSAPILEYVQALAREEGPGNKQLNDLLVIRLPFVPPIYFLFKDTYVRRVLSSEPDAFPSSGDTGVMVKIAAHSGNNILLSPGPPNPHWARYREISSPLNRDRFGEGSMLAQMFNIAWKSMEELTPAHFDTKKGVDLILFKELFEVMIPSHNRALFGEECEKKFTYKALNEEVYDIISETGKQLKFNICPPWIKKAYMAKINRVTETVRLMMKDSPSAFMKPLLDAKKSGAFSDEELHSNVMIFEFAQAPLHVAFWLLYALAVNPEVEKKLVSEISNVLSRGPLTHERLGEFKYLTRVVMETLRMYPGVGLLQVRNSKYNTVFGEHFIPEGAFVFLCAYVIHRNATYWPNPDEFDPMREGIDAATYGENITYIPFGNGPRQCQGQYFALDFVKLSIISILRRFKVTLAPGQKEVIPTEIGFLRPVYPIFVRFEDRVLPAARPQDDEPAKSPTLPFTPSPSSSSAPSPALSPSLSSRALPGFGPPRSLSPALSRLTPLGGSSRQLPLDSPSQLNLSPLAKKKLPSRLSKSGKAASLASQSQIFKDTFTSIGKAKTTNDMLVLYGTQTGTSRRFATRIVHMAKLCKLATTLVSLGDLDVTTVKNYKHVVIATSTYGDGGAPENAEKFRYWLETETKTDLFNGVPFAVLALGSSMYPFPFKFGNFVSQRFVQMGARRLIPDKRLDEIKYNQEEEFTKWSAKLFEAISADTTTEKHRELIIRNKILGFHNFDFNVLVASFKLSFDDKHLAMEPRSYYKGVTLATVVSNTLVNSDPSNLVYSMETKLKAGSQPFHAGDIAVVVPVNPLEQVERLINRLGYEKGRLFTLDHDETGSVEVSCSLGRNKCTLQIAFSYFFDITSPPSTSLLQFLALRTDDIQEQKVLLSYVANYQGFLKLNQSVLELLEGMPSIKFITEDPRKNEDTLALFLGMLGPIKHRHYSVANFPDSDPDMLRIVYKLVMYTTNDGREKSGLCSNYLKTMQAGQEIAVQFTSTKFRLPKDTSPVILVSAGAGISPYIGFLEQRLHHKQKGDALGKSILIHGCRTEPDFALKAKVDAATVQGVFTHVWSAYSRVEPKARVQDIIVRQGQEIWNYLQEGGTVYVCGDLSINVTVREALLKVAKNHGNMNIFAANTWVRKLGEAGRIRSDEWGTSTISAKSLVRAARLKLWRKSILAIFAFHLPTKKQ